MPIIIRDGKEVLLTAAKSIEISTGEAPKSFLTDGHNLYVLKRPKKRTFSTIFRESFPSDLAEYRHWTLAEFHYAKGNLPPLKKAKLEPYAQHLNNLLFEAALGEILYQRIARALFESFEATENYLHIDKDTGEPCIISKFCPNFNEFPEKRLGAAAPKRKTSASEWEGQTTPQREALKFSENEYYLLGKLYALALITNDWDLVNNIMLSNAGCLGDSSCATKIMVVDGGNKFHFGFDGLTCDETAFQNKEFNSEATKSHPLRGYDHTLPFDEEVYLQLPRLLIPDLFSLTIPKLHTGFKDGINEAKRALIDNPLCIQQAIKEAELFITSDSHKLTIKRFKDKDSTLLNCSYYYSTNGAAYNLDSILKARCHSLRGICMRLERGETMEAINRSTLTRYKQAQWHPTVSSFFSEAAVFSDPQSRSLPSYPLSIIVNYLS